MLQLGEENVLQESDLTDIATFVDTYQQIVLPVFSHPMAAKPRVKARRHTVYLSSV